MRTHTHTSYLMIFGHYVTEKKAAGVTTTTTPATTTTTKTSNFMIRVLPAGPQPQRISEDIPDRMPERIAENI